MGSKFTSILLTRFRRVGFMSSTNYQFYYPIEKKRPNILSKTTFRLIHWTYQFEVIFLNEEVTRFFLLITNLWVCLNSTFIAQKAWQD